MPENDISSVNFEALNQHAVSQPLVTHLYTADPSAHVFNNRIFIYPSHDVENDTPFDDLGSHFAMQDYHVFSLTEPGGEVTDHGIALHVADVPWADKQMWAPDAAERDGNYYLYFPAKDKQGIFRIGVAVGNRPEGPFIAEPEPIAGSFSIDPAVYQDDDGAYYLYFGGLWGGQLQRWRSGAFNAAGAGPFAHLPKPDEPALCAKMAKLHTDMKSFAEPPCDIVILDEAGIPLLAGDNTRRFFEGPWMHKYNGLYYFSYSTGDTHLLCYATATSPYGPFTYRGVLLEPVVGWTTHHSIIQFNGKWYLFYHDSSMSRGVTHLRCIKMTEIFYNEDGSIQPVKPYGDFILQS